MCDQFKLSTEWTAYEKDERFPVGYSGRQLKEILFIFRKSMFQPLGDIPYRRILSLVNAANEELAERNSKRVLIISLIAIVVALYSAIKPCL